MKLFVSCDEYCYLYNGKYYLSRNGIIFSQRYLTVFDEVRFFLRTKNIKDPRELDSKFELKDKRADIYPAPFFQGPRQYASSFFKIKRLATDAIKGCDAAIFRLPSTIAFDAWEAWKKTKRPYFTEIVFDCHDASQNVINPIERILWKRLHHKQVKVCKNSDGVSCVTESYLQRQYYPTKPDAPTSHYSSIELTDDFYLHARKYPIKDRIRLIHIANQVMKGGKKGHDEVIKALNKTIKNGLNAEVVFVGADYRNGISELKKLAKEEEVEQYVRFSGFLNKTELREELLNADIAILPTRAEGLPRVVIESMAMGLPVITSPVSGNPELIDPDFLVEYSDVDKLANKIMDLCKNPSLYECQSITNFNRSKSYSNKILNERRKAFYKELYNKI